MDYYKTKFILVQCPMSCLSWGHWPSLFYWLCGRLKYPAATANHYSELHCFCPPATQNYSDSRQEGLGQGGADWWLPRVETPRPGEHSADIGLSQSSPGYLDLALPGLSSLILFDCYSGCTAVLSCNLRNLETVAKQLLIIIENSKNSS